MSPTVARRFRSQDEQMSRPCKATILLHLGLPIQLQIPLGHSWEWMWVSSSMELRVGAARWTDGVWFDISTPLLLLLFLFWLFHCFGQRMGQLRDVTLILRKGSVASALQVWMNIALNIMLGKNPKAISSLPLLYFSFWFDEPSSHEHITFRSRIKAEDYCLSFSSMVTKIKSSSFWCG